MNIVEKRKTWFAISIIIIIAGLLAMPINAMMGNGILNFDVEFIGGTVMEVNIGQDFDITNDIRPIVIEITGDESPQITRSGDQGVSIKTKSIDATTRTKLYDALKEKYNLDGMNDLLNVDDVSPTISTEMQVKALQALLVSSILMLIYITFRFKDWRFGLAAVLPLIHDVLIVLAVYSIGRVPVNNSFIAAILTIVGYSINDTIVIFDRIRENRKVAKKGDLEGLVNRSISQTIVRSINTSITTLLTITVLYFLGVPSIKEFALPLIVGIISGTYSSIFIASPLWYEFHKKSIAKTA
ncbi:protein translocase subunit SecF [Defluviitalea raffinosedens]|uniref:protein translocase subunit SecF n=1 Tax=Defluviitalea raffinosedens TaxID=1450156 RepID=UPI0017607FDA|nr:protein translocase subunit SecF [Defluviitalea raffinosedens]MBM7684769.1 preprotein translocase SecF subunit [Defluviitalea raffinosedens]HHW66999.1 protein translocase subunit SecF [Candidatus Epulonipiscium sp.]